MNNYHHFLFYSSFILLLILNGSPHVIASSVCVCTITPGDCLCTLEGLKGGDDKIVEEELLVINRGITLTWRSPEVE